MFPQAVLTLDPAHRLVEGVATNGPTIFLTSVLDRQVLSCRQTCRTIFTLPAGLHPFAIAYDRRFGSLWIGADCPSGVPGIVPCDRGAVFVLTQAGRVRARLSPPAGPFHPGDISVARGQAFVSDSQNGAVYRIRFGGRTLEPLVPAGVGKSGQGSVTAADGRSLIVADYSQGVGAIDLVTRKRTILMSEAGKPLRGIDGVARCGDTYFGIYNDANPGALVAFSRSGDTIHYDQPLGDAGLNDPTQIAFDGGRLLIVTNSGWAALAKNAKPRSGGAAIVAVPLNSACRPAQGVKLH